MLENTESQEMYLTTIYALQKKNGMVRSVDVADERGYSKVSVHNAMKRLEEFGYVTFHQGKITLTKCGIEKVKNIEQKHQTIASALKLIGASNDIAEENACRMEHVIIADEAHLFIDAKFPIALDFFFSMSKRIRKYNGSFIPATQNIADWNANEELRSKTSAILKNSQYTFIFKLSAPDMKDVLDVYKAGDSFNADEQRMIISAVTGQVFFIGSTELRTNVKITTGEYIKSLFEDKTGENYNKEGN